MVKKPHQHAPITLGATAVERLLAHVEILQDMRKQCNPCRLLALQPEDKGDFITYLDAGTNAGVFGAKLSSNVVIGGNHHAGRGPVSAVRCTTHRDHRTRISCRPTLVSCAKLCTWQHVHVYSPNLNSNSECWA